MRCPLLVLAYDDDTSALAEPAVRAAEKAPQGQLVRQPGGHYESFLGGFDDALQIELRFLREHLLAKPGR